LEGLRAIVEEDLSKVVESPLRPARGSGYGCLPLEAVQPARRLHEMLLRIVGPGGDPATLDDADTAADLHARLQALVAPIDPNHPFLKVEFEFDGDSDGGGAVGGDDDEKDQDQQQTSSAKAKGEQVAEQPSKKGKGKQVAEQPNKKGKGKQAAGTRRSKIDDRIREFRIFPANQLQRRLQSKGLVEAHVSSHNVLKFWPTNRIPTKTWATPNPTKAKTTKV
jgi:hypothetical protein